MHSRIRLTALAAALLSQHLPLAAADNVQSLLPLSLDELIATPVVTASRRPEGREQTPAHIMVITREQMRDRRYKSLADLLEDLPGVDFQRGTRSGYFNNFVFQGHVSNNKILILQDGVRVDHPLGGKIAIAENFNLYHVKQVEILYGPAAALYGADAFGGVINMITEKPGDTPTGRVSVGVGSFDTRETSIQAGARLGERWSISAGAHSQQSDRAPLNKYYPDSYPKVAARNSAGATVIPAGQREDYTGPINSDSQFLRLDAGEVLTFGFYRNRFKSLTSNGDKPETSVYRDDVFWDASVETVYGKLRFGVGEPLSGELVIDQSTYEVNPQTRYINKFTDFQNHGYDYAYSQRRGIEQNLTWKAADAHTLQGGLAYRHYFSIETPDLSHPYDTGLDAYSQGMLYANTTLPLQAFQTSYYSYSGYLQWQAQWNPAFSTTAGLRKDWYSTYGGSLNPRLGAVWQPLPGNYLKLLYGEAFRAPSPDETLSAFGSFSGAMSGGTYSGTNFRAPNQSLKPEKSRTLSLTWDWRPRKDFNVVTNAYLSRVGNVVITGSDNSGTVCPFGTGFLANTQYIPGATLCNSTTKINSGQDRYQGVDIIPQWQTHLGGPWTADVWGSYSWIRGRVQESVGGVEWDQTNIASQKVKAGVTLRYQDWLTVTPRLQWIGETTTGRKNTLAPGERVTVAPYALASLHIGAHKLGGDNLSLYFDIYNLLDKRYYLAHASSSDTLIGVPGQPRTFVGTLEYRF